MKRFYKILIISCVLITTTRAQQNQDSTKIEVPQIAVMARPQQDGKILLRWAPTTPRAWRNLNKYGYELTRYTITRDKKTLNKPEEKILGNFLPKPLDDWMKIIEKNDNAAVVAQSLYGEKFDIEGLDELTAIVNLSEEQQQRFTWALYAADQDFDVAIMAGLGYVDTAIKPNEKYIYKLTSLVPIAKIEIKDGGVFIGLQDFEILPKPLDLSGIFMDSKVMLNWNYAIHKQIYNSYFVERSEDGKLFSKLNNLPITSLNNSDKTNAKRMFYIDSIANNKSYYYRIKGKTPFGELSPPSETISGIGKKLLEYVPRITNKNYLDDKRIILEWEFPKEGNEHIKGFELNRSNKATGVYKTIIKNIPSEVRKIQYDSLQPTNYLTITAIGKNGGKRTSFAALIQPVDSIPPVKPVGFEGKVDSLGVVTLKWKANIEKDMLGYRVFRGNNKNEEYSQITTSPHRGTIYYDSIAIKNLNSKVFYKLIAVDQRFNMSKPSEILELKKPDVIPPTQPIITAYKIKDKSVQLTWAKSSSDDVIKHELYRKVRDSANWRLIHIIALKNLNDKNSPSNEKNNFENWADFDINEGEKYSYTVVAVDDSNLESKPAPPITVIIPKTSLKQPIKRLGSYVDKKNGYIEIFWKEYKEPNVAELMIYKGVKDKPITLLRNVLPNIKRVLDTRVKPNNEYVYMIRAVFKDGTLSEISKLDVKY